MAEGIKELVEYIQKLFPKFKVDESDILQPTTEFVVHLYNLLLNEFQDIVLSVGNPTEEINHHEKLLTPPEIYYEISKIVSNIKFKLSDIYKPNYIRTKSFLKMILHFHTFSLELQANLTPQLYEIVQKKENMYILLEEKYSLSEVLTENITRKATCLDEADKISEKLNSIEKTYSEMQQRKAERNKIYEDKERQIEELSQSIYLENLTLQKEEKEREDLLEQIVTEAEYNNILELRDSLKNELNTLNDDHAREDKLLSDKNEMLKYHQDCRKTLPDISELHSLENVNRLIKSKVLSKDLKIKLDKLSDMKSQTDLKLKQEEQKFNEVSGKFQCLKTAVDDENRELFEQKEKLKQANTELCKSYSKSQHILETAIKEKKAILMNIKEERLELIKHVDHKFNEISTYQKKNYSKCYAALESTKS